MMLQNKLFQWVLALVVLTAPVLAQAEFSLTCRYGTFTSDPIQSGDQPAFAHFTQTHRALRGIVEKDLLANLAGADYPEEHLTTPAFRLSEIGKKKEFETLAIPHSGGKKLGLTVSLVRKGPHAGQVLVRLQEYAANGKQLTSKLELSESQYLSAANLKAGMALSLEELSADEVDPQTFASISNRLVIPYVVCRASE